MSMDSIINAQIMKLETEIVERKNDLKQIIQKGKQLEAKILYLHGGIETLKKLLSAPDSKKEND